MQRYFLIALGGALGSLARFWVGSIVLSRTGGKFPYGTLVVNLSACLIIGFTMDLLGRRSGWSEAWRYLVPIGFIGAYSTFSTFEWEIFSTLKVGGFAVAALYAAVSVFLGLIAVWCGASLAKAF